MSTTRAQPPTCLPQTLRDVQTMGVVSTREVVQTWVAVWALACLETLGVVQERRCVQTLKGVEKRVGGKLWSRPHIVLSSVADSSLLVTQEKAEALLKLRRRSGSLERSQPTASKSL